MIEGRHERLGDRRWRRRRRRRGRQDGGGGGCRRSCGRGGRTHRACRTSAAGCEDRREQSRGYGAAKHHRTCDGSGRTSRPARIGTSKAKKQRSARYRFDPRLATSCVTTAGSTRRSYRPGCEPALWLRLNGLWQEDQEVPAGDAQDEGQSNDERPARLPDPQPDHHREEQDPDDDLDDQR